MPNWCENKLVIRGKEKEEVEACLAAIRGDPRDLSGEVVAEPGADVVAPPVGRHAAGRVEPPEAIDFGKIVPMPGSLAVEDSSVGDDALLAFHGKNDPLGLKLGITVESLCEREGVATREELQERLLRKHPECRKLADAYLENIRLYGCKTWYGWSQENWGTKWNACDVVAKTRDTKRGMTATLEFRTAWAPPAPVIRRLIESWPRLNFALWYWEGGSGFQGEMTGEGGVVRDEGSWEYSGPRGG